MYNVIVNPNSGKGRARRALKKLTERFEAQNAEYRIFETVKPRQAVDFAEQLTSEGPCEIVAMGGDGTIHEVLNGFVDFENCILDILPCGTGNDFVKCIDIPKHFEKAMDIMFSCEPKYTDFMQMGGIRGINAIGTGIDVDVLRRHARAKIFNGKFGYFVSLIVSLIKFKNYEFTTLVNGEKKHRSAFLACVGNGRVIGGNIPMCPTAVPDDGLLDLTVVDNVKKSRIPGALMKLMKGRIHEFDTCEVVRCENVEVFPDSPMTVQVDGELYDNVDFNVRIVKNTLKIRRP